VYQDIGIGIATGIPSGLPSLHARLLDAIGLAHGRRVMQVGAGTGYFTAILAELRLGPERPDATSWLAGDGWWLSTAAAPDA
jgi:protein-L-isoaspartate(D-aspartate) O-methyltransferase